MGLISTIGDAVGSVTDAISDVADAVGLSGVADAVGLDDVFDAITGMGVGGWFNDLSDSLGLPDWFGDVAGAVADAVCGNPLGAVANGLDALDDVALACGADELSGFLKAGAGLTDAFMGDVGAFESVDDAAALFTQLKDTLEEVPDHRDLSTLLAVLDPAYSGGTVAEIAHELVIRP